MAILCSDFIIYAESRHGNLFSASAMIETDGITSFLMHYTIIDNKSLIHWTADDLLNPSLMDLLSMQIKERESLSSSRIIIEDLDSLLWKTEGTVYTERARCYIENGKIIYETSYHTPFPFNSSPFQHC